MNMNATGSMTGRMRLAVFSPFLLLLLPLCTRSNAAAETQPAAFVQDAEHADDEESELIKQMTIVNDATKKLRRSIRDEAKNSETLALLDLISTAAIASKAETPAMTATLPEADRDAFVKAYRNEMISFVRLVLNIEEALLAGEQEKAQSLFKELRGSEDPGHERFVEGG